MKKWSIKIEEEMVLHKEKEIVVPTGDRILPI